MPSSAVLVSDTTLSRFAGSMNQLWPHTPPQPNVPVKLTHRVVMNFYTAKRLLHGLNFAVSRFEAAFGELELDVQKRVRVLQGPGGGMRTS